MEIIAFITRFFTKSMDFHGSSIMSTNSLTLYVDPLIIPIFARNDVFYHSVSCLAYRLLSVRTRLQNLFSPC
jgi:hypothetical protein